MQTTQPRGDADVIAELGTAPGVENRLWVHLSMLDKRSELARCAVAGTTVALRHAKASATSPGSIGSFSVTPNLESAGTGLFRALDFVLGGMSAGTLVETCFDVAGLKKGDRLQVFSSAFPYGFKNLKVFKYDPQGQLQLIHEQDSPPDGYSVHLDWPWQG